MGALFSPPSPPQVAAAPQMPQIITAPTPMPTPDPDAQRRAALKQNAAAMQGATTRQSTIIGDDSLG